jgi:hypothetical protein
MPSVRFEKDGVIRAVESNKENLFCMQTAGWTQLDAAPVAKVEQVATITAQSATRRPGRPRKEQIPSILNDGAEDGDSTDTD